jgi:hypothetical protein
VASEVVFCDLPPVPQPGVSLYAHLGRAAGQLLSRYVVDGSPVANQLRNLDLAADQTLFGHGVLFDSRGRNTKAAAVALQWKGLQIVQFTEGPTIC